eukprot:15066236-Ditylum_brightwellii.AAC.1
MGESDDQKQSEYFLRRHLDGPVRTITYHDEHPTEADLATDRRSIRFAQRTRVNSQNYEKVSFSPFHLEENSRTRSVGR